MEKDMCRAGYDFQSPDNGKPRLERGARPDPRKSYSSTRPCSRPSSIPWCERRSSGSSMRCPTLQADEIANAARYVYLVRFVTFLNSNMWYVTNLPGKNAECLCHGPVEVFEHISGVSPVIVMDNACLSSNRSACHEVVTFC